jgi:hypothetical protein
MIIFICLQCDQLSAVMFLREQLTSAHAKLLRRVQEGLPVPGLCGHGYTLQAAEVRPETVAHNCYLDPALD